MYQFKKNCINIIIQLNKHILMKRTIIFIFIRGNSRFIYYNLILKHIYFSKHFCITSRNYSTNVLHICIKFAQFLSQYTIYMTGKK